MTGERSAVIAFGGQFFNLKFAVIGGDDFKALGRQRNEILERGDKSLGGGFDFEVPLVLFRSIALVESHGDFEVAPRVEVPRPKPREECWLN